MNRVTIEAADADSVTFSLLHTGSAPAYRTTPLPAFWSAGVERMLMGEEAAKSVWRRLEASSPA